MTGRVAILAIAVVAPVVTMALPARAWFAQRAEIRQLEVDVAAATDRVEGLQAQRERWEDPAYVVTQARERLHYVRPGEIGYTVVGVDGETAFDPAPDSTSTASDADEPQTWFTRLWHDVRAVDRRR